MRNDAIKSIFGLGWNWKGFHKRKSRTLFLRTPMKHPFFKSILVLGAALALVNCNEEIPTGATTPEVGDNGGYEQPVTGNNNGQLVVTDVCWVLDAGQTLLIYPTGIVTDASGAPIGTYLGDSSNGTIYTVDGSTVIASGVNLGLLPTRSPETSVGGNTPVVASSASVVAKSSASVIAKSSASTAKSSASNTTPKSSASQQTQPKSSANQQSADGTCFDPIQNKQVPKDVGQKVNETQYAYTGNDCTFACWDDINKCNALTGNAPKSSASQQNQPKSSASQAKSSSSQQQTQPKSSASQQQQGTTPNFEVVQGGKSGRGYATRYWDSCKPHCAWSGKAGPATTPTRTCHADGSLAGTDEKSACDGGQAGTCLSQIPQIINDNLAYAFAATPGGEGDCGRCYLLEFDGGTKENYDPVRNHALKGKKLVVMSSNIGYDVAGGQFDLMIPGGGVGAFSGCHVMGLSCAGKQYGGLLGTCQDKGGSDSDIINCLKSSCQQEYGNNKQAYEGCMFMATFMNGADNPSLSYKEIKCPSELAARW